MPVFAMRVVVTLRSDILDPAGLAVEHALRHAVQHDAQGSAPQAPAEDTNIQERSVRLGRVVDIAVQAAHADAAYRLIDRHCQTLLHNPVMERYEILNLGTVDSRDTTGKPGKHTAKSDGKTAASVKTTASPLAAPER